ncbi:Uncharacterised protein [Mycobacterium tuberculosis]|nr:Uncharacterised protein [Mycobacterium tuberculosis]
MKACPSRLGETQPLASSTMLSMVQIALMTITAHTAAFDIMSREAR